MCWSVILSIDLEIAPYPWILGYSQFAFGSVISLIHQEITEKSSSPVHQVRGVYTLVLAVDLIWPVNRIQPLLAMVWEPLDITDLDNHSTTMEPLWKSRSPAEKLQHTVVGEKSEIGHTEEEKNLTLLMSALPRVGQASARGSLLGPLLFTRRKVRTYEWVPSFLSCVGRCQTGSFLPHCTRITE